MTEQPLDPTPGKKESFTSAQRELPSAAPVWTDGIWLKLRKTTSPLYYFLEVADDVIPYMRPFMELEELNAIEYSAQGEEGWMILVDMYPKLSLFLLDFREYVPPTWMDIGRSPESAGSEYTPMTQTQKDRASVRNITFQEIRLLALLYLSLQDKSQLNHPELDFYHELLRGLVSTNSYSELRRLALVPIDTEVGYKLRTFADVFELDLKFRALYTQYALHRYGNDTTQALVAGDILKPAYRSSKSVTDDEYFIYNGSEFEPLDHSGMLDVDIVPPSFKVPTMFPIMWWNGVIDTGDVVHPDFDRLLSEMEYVAEPELPQSLKDWFSHKVHPRHVAALRFQWKGQTYYIYFLEGDIEPTYENVLKNINFEENDYYAIDDTSIAIYTLDTE